MVISDLAGVLQNAKSKENLSVSYVLKIVNIIHEHGVVQEKMMNS